MTFHYDVLLSLAPRALPLYRAAFVSPGALFERYELTTVLRLQHFLAQVMHESDGLTLTTENLNYSADRLMLVWPTRFRTHDSAEPFARNPRALANHVYGRRLGNTESDDGWRYLGRGLLQLTGKDSYRRIGEALGVDLVADPERLLQAGVVLHAACETWKQAGCNAFADQDDLTRVTKTINGGQIGIASRRLWLSKVIPVVEDHDDL